VVKVSQGFLLFLIAEICVRERKWTNPSSSPYRTAKNGFWVTDGELQGMNKKK
jgi:hypothetical protein